MITALSIAGTGREISERLAKHFLAIEAFVGADAAQLMRVEGIGVKKARQIEQQLPRAARIVEKLAAAGVNLVSAPVSRPPSGPLVGKVVVVTGSMVGPLATYDRVAMNALVKAAGGAPGRSMTAKTSLLVVGERAGSKLAKARDLGVEIMDEPTFAVLVADFTC
ncbi:helix-hairpin-helix domain-containing protein [Streptomyces goshikiensis]|uniref:helix-hairpin-helix domain-containing protein n=1 Tax=Streptomyces goshikiensis TaxID=1942 RepID=UPI0036D1302B